MLVDDSSVRPKRKDPPAVNASSRVSPLPSPQPSPVASPKSSAANSPSESVSSFLSGIISEGKKDIEQTKKALNDVKVAKKRDRHEAEAGKKGNASEGKLRHERTKDQVFRRLPPTTRMAILALPVEQQFMGLIQHLDAQSSRLPPHQQHLVQCEPTLGDKFERLLEFLAANELLLE